MDSIYGPNSSDEPHRLHGNELSGNFVTEIKGSRSEKKLETSASQFESISPSKPHLEPRIPAAAANDADGIENREAYQRIRWRSLFTNMGRKAVAYVTDFIDSPIGEKLSDKATDVLKKIPHADKFIGAYAHVTDLLTGPLALYNVRKIDRTQKKQIKNQSAANLSEINDRNILKEIDDLARNKKATFDEIRSEIKFKYGVDLNQVRQQQGKKPLKRKKEIRRVVKSNGFCRAFIEQRAKLCAADTKERIRSSLLPFTEQDTPAKIAEEAFNHLIEKEHLSLPPHVNSLEAFVEALGTDAAFNVNIDLQIYQRQQTIAAMNELLENRRAAEESKKSAVRDEFEDFLASTGKVESVNELFALFREKGINLELLAVRDDQSIGSVDAIHRYIDNDREKLLEEHVRYRDTLSVSARNGLKAMGEAKMRIERNFFAFEKIRTYVLVPTDIFVACVGISSLALSSIGGPALPAVAVTALGMGASCLYYGFSAAGVVHKLRHKPNTFIDENFKLREPRAAVQRVRQTFYGLYHDFNLQRKKLEEKNLNAISAKVQGELTPEEFRRVKHAIPRGLRRYIDPEVKLSEADMEFLKEKKSRYERRVNSLDKTVKVAEEKFESARMRAKHHEQSVLRAGVKDTKRKLSPLKLVFEEGNDNAPNLFEAVVKLQTSGTLDEQSRKELFRSTGIDAGELQETFIQNTEELKSAYRDAFLEFFGGTYETMVEIAEKKSKAKDKI